VGNVALQLGDACGGERLSEAQMNNQVRLLLAILSTLALPLLTAGNSEKTARRVAQSTLDKPAEKSRSTNALYSYNMINDEADAGEAPISAGWRNPNTARHLSSRQTGSRRRRRAPRLKGDQTLEVPRAIDPKPSDSDDELSAIWQHNGEDLQLEPAGVASGVRQSFPGIARPIGTIRDYENEAKKQTAPTVCVASQWWWTSGVAVCVPAPRSPGAAAYRSP
jgi:hypothetical protein